MGCALLGLALGSFAPASLARVWSVSRQRLVGQKCNPLAVQPDVAGLAPRGAPQFTHDARAHVEDLGPGHAVEELEGLGRVTGFARAGEILVSSTVKDLTAGSGLQFEDAGEHELKGVPERWHLYRVLS
jgi:hypothetical protein